MESLNSYMERLEWRRNKVLELSSQGHSQPEISRILQIGLGTVNRDLSYIRQQSKQNIRKYIDERLPEEYEKCMVGLNAILREAWNTSQQARQEREKIQALLLAKECYSMKLDLLTNATVVDDAIRFVSCYEHNNQQRQKKDSSTIIEREEKKEEEKAIDVDHITRNQVF